MPDISKIKLPSGNVYDIVDAGARELIEALSGSTAFLGVTTTPLVDDSTTNPIVIDGNNVTAKNGNIVIYSKGEFIFNGTKWVEFGDLSSLGALASKDTVTLSKGSGTNVLGTGATFTAPASSVSFSGGTTDKALGIDTTFSVTQPTITVTPSTTNIKATASGTAVGANGTAAAITGFGAHETETFVKSVTAETSNKLVTTTVPNVTGNTNVSIPNVTGNTSVSIPNVTSNVTKAFSINMGSGTDATTLIFSGDFDANNEYDATLTGLGTELSASKVTLGTALSASKVTLGTAKTVATGAVAANGEGAAIVTDVTIGDSASAITALGTPTTSNCLTGVKVTTQPTIALATGAGAGTGVISVATGISSATAAGAAVTAGTNDQVTAVTSVGTATTAASTVTVNTFGTNGSVKVAKYDDLDVSVS